MNVKPKNGAPERRFFQPPELRVEDPEGGDGPILRGYAAVFEQMSEPLGYFTEKIRAGAFTKSLQEDDIRGLFNHDPNFVLGRNRAGTLELWEDVTGLGFRLRPPDTTWAKDLLLSIDRGDISQMSFGFITRTDEWDRKDDGARIRTLVDVRLLDVSPVTYPAYPQTSVSARTLAGAGITLDELAEAYAALRSGDADAEHREALQAFQKSLATMLLEPGPTARSKFDLRRRRLELSARMFRG